MVQDGSKVGTGPLATPAAGPQASESLTTLGSAAPQRRRTSVWQRFRRHRLALIGLTILVLLAIVSIGAPLFTQHGPYSVDLRSARMGPTSSHILGSDPAGRDVFSRLLYAGRVSLSVGIVAVAIYTVIGVVLGAVAGFYGGWVDSTIMRLADIVLAFPSLLIIITVVSVLGPSLFNIMLVIGLLGWPPITRLLRGEFLSLREREFIVAARATGARNNRLMFRHLLPNAIAPIIVAATFGVANAILLEAGLSFLGLGVQPPTPSWGSMLTGAQSLTVLESMPWLWVPPGVMIAVAVLSINFIGDGLRDALDPYLSR
ncbi:MAG TPA: oligopeptide ABC transporter permease [Thermomicrobiales bacterium]|nr:oligopeptide ABC transporter permease [Thermomicrobiales bacterium]